MTMIDGNKGDFKNTLLIIIGTLFFFWIFETIVELYLIHPEAKFFDTLFPHDLHELWMRSLTVFLAIFTVILFKTLSKHRKMEKLLKQSEDSYRRNFILQKTISSILEQTGEGGSGESRMNKILDIILNSPLFDSQGKGCIFIGCRTLWLRRAP